MVSLEKSHANTIFSGDSGTMAISQPLRFDQAHTTDSESTGPTESKLFQESLREEVEIH